MTLQTTEVPPAGQAVIHLPTDPVPKGLRAGQTLIMAEGGELGNQFTISGNSQVDHLYAYGGGINISGGTVNRWITLYEGSSLTLTGGETRDEISAWGNSSVEIRGGRLADGLFVNEGAQAMLEGSDFRIDGELVDDSEYGSITAVDLPPRSVLSGVFSDGTPFAFNSSDGDWFAPGTLQVSTQRFNRPTLGIRFPLMTNPPPRGLRPGDELTLEPGEQVGANFTAGWDSKLTIALSIET